MMSRGEIAAILIAASLPESLAWRMALSLSADCLESATPASVRANADDLLLDYKRRSGDLDETAPAAWGWAR